MESIEHTKMAEVCILCADARFAHAMAHEVERLGWTATVVAAPFVEGERGFADVALILADGDDADDAAWAELRRRTTCPWVMWARRAVDLPGVTVLHRPFDLGALIDALRVAMRGVHLAVPSVPVVNSPSILVPTVRVVSDGVLEVGEQIVALTPSEWAIYRCLDEHRGEVVSREALAACLAGGGGNSVDVYVCHLRAKLEKPLGVRMVWTVRGKGYRME